MVSFDGLLLTGLHWAVLALAVWALVDALIRPAPAYVAAGKLTKPAWVAITALAAGAHLLRAPLALPRAARRRRRDRLPGRRAPRAARPAAGQQQLVSAGREPLSG